ncbi:acyltransferase [Micromonospora yasonensis]|uniref:acyltransferase family protein n=1 Tax=Micromonospora yasonensis TaxID=1128667 RepID=UPI002230E13F|nr:acyltransferase [Micromonospora yasonensis]MCW3840875.1 acyltransferase [Micromonospora yasonensis]
MSGRRLTDGGRVSRDRVVDALRAYAIGGVVLGHWLVTALVLDADGTLHVASPLASMPALAPLTWLLQTLGLFFFVAGYAATRSLSAGAAGPMRWWARRLGRLVGPALALLGIGAAVLLAAIVVGTPDATLSVALLLVASPLWFLLPLVALSALTVPLRAAVRRWGPLRCAAPAVALVAAADAAGRVLPTLPGRLPVALLAAWSVPWLLGIAHADGHLAGRRTGAVLAGTGAVALAALFALGYPVSAVGVPGATMSNLSPPSLVAVALAVAQVGLALLARPAVERLLDRAGPRRAVATVNRHAMGVYLGHQPVLVGVTALAAHAGAPLPGLHTAPRDLLWVLARLCWLPVFAAALAALQRRRHRSPVAGVGGGAPAGRVGRLPLGGGRSGAAAGRGPAGPGPGD